jgi:type IV secretory pathway TrbD component
MNIATTSLGRSSLPVGVAVALTLFGIVLIAVFTGLALGSGAYLFAAPVAALLPAALLLLRPDICLIVVAGLVLMVAGILKFFLGLGQFQWLVSALGITLLFVALTKTVFSRERVKASATGIELSLALWWALIVFASLANFVPVNEWVVGIRIYLPFLGVFAYIAYCRPSERLLKGLILFLLLIASVQWAFCIYQKFVIVPQRMAGGYPGSPWDSVVGTFGGEKFGGGESGSLGVFLAVVLTIAAALHKARMLGGVAFAMVMFFGLIAVGLSESKVVVLLVPLGALIVYHDYLVKHPVRFLLGAALVAGFVLALLITYYFVYWQSSTRLGLVDSIIQRLSYSFDPDFRVSAVNLGRFGSLVFWWDSHSILDNPLTFLLGNGLASAVGTSTLIGMGSATRVYGYVLDSTGASKLLWESGLLGLLLFLSLFVVGFFRARRLARLDSVPPWHRAALGGVQAGMVLMFLAVFYEVTTVSSPPMQFVLMLLLGYIVYWWRETRGGKP